MRIIGGEWRGRPLQAPPGRTTRPTADKVREALFDVLADGVGGATVLDLFAGSGALGLEALSRGAAEATFVERAPAALRALRANLNTLALSAPRARLRAQDFRRALAADARQGRMYTLVLVDPPYARYAQVERDLARLLPAVCAPQATVVVETGTGRSVVLPLIERRTKVYGDTKLVFLTVGV